MRLKVFRSAALFVAIISSGTQTRCQAVPATLQACAAFTSDGLSLEASVTAEEIALSIEGPARKAVTVALPIPPSADVPASQENDPKGCSLIIDRADDEATIAVPFQFARDGSGFVRAILVARFDLNLSKWSKSFLVEPPVDFGPVLRTSFLVGYLEGSKNLFVVKSDGRTELYNENYERVDGRFLHGESGHGLVVGADPANNRLWGSCPEPAHIFAHAEPCDLNSVTLTGEEEPGPKIYSPWAAHEKDVEQWTGPYFFASLGPSAVAFGGYPTSAIARSHYLWVANLANGSTQQMRLHSIWDDNSMTGRFAVSPDGSVLAFGVIMSKLECCFVDNYKSKGERLLIADVTHMRQVADVRPPNNQSPLGFAVDHRNGKTVLVVNWGSGWTRAEYPDVRGGN
jgi:hypothetical protein